MLTPTALRGQILSLIGQTQSHIDQMQIGIDHVASDDAVVDKQTSIKQARFQLQNARSTLDGVITGEHRYKIDAPRLEWSKDEIWDEQVRSLLQTYRDDGETSILRERLESEAQRLMEQWTEQKPGLDEARLKPYWQTFADLCQVFKAMGQLGMHDTVSEFIATDKFIRRLDNWVTDLGPPHILLAESLIDAGLADLARRVIIDGVTLLRDSPMSEEEDYMGYISLADHTGVAHAMSHFTKLAFRLDSPDLLSEICELTEGFGECIVDRVIPSNFIAKELYAAGRETEAKVLFEYSITAANEAQFYDDFLRVVAHTAVLMYTVGLPLDLSRLGKQMEKALTIDEGDMDKTLDNREGLFAEGLSTLCELGAYQLIHSQDATSNES